jgi:3-oxoacyl-[acyl-carrier protein] reductase
MGSGDGRVALVTGGSRGIGAAVARRLATDGADVAITYLSAADRAAEVVADVERAGRRGLAIQADGAVAQAAAEAVERTVAELGRLDVLVNNAGVFPTGPVEDVGPEELERTLALGEYARPEDIAATVAHLASPEAHYLTGAAISVDGGFAA